MRHVINVNGTYHYRRRVPGDLILLVGKAWWKQSLKTANQREAEMSARSLAVSHDRFIQQLRSASPRSKIMMLAERAAAARESADAFWDATLAFANNGQWVKNGDKVAAKALQKAERARTKLERAMLAAANPRVKNLPHADRDLIEKSGGLGPFIKRAQGSASQQQDLELNLAFRGLAPAELSATYDYELAAAKLGIEKRRLAQAQGVLDKLGLAPLVDEVAEDPQNPKINTACDIWLKERGQGIEAANRHRVAVRRFVELFGDMTVRDITRDVVIAYKDAIQNLSDHRLLPTNARGTMDSVADLRKVSAPTVGRHLISIKALLQFCVEKDWTGRNVAQGVKAPADTRPKAHRRRSMHREELARFIERAVAEYGEDSERVWLIKLAAYTGGRLQEIAQLSRNNVKLIDGVWVIEINDDEGRKLKNECSMRNVPLHSAIRDPFLAWLKKTDRPDRDRVFMSLKAKDGCMVRSLSGDMARLMDRAGIMDSQVVMHSLRHGLTVAMADAGIHGDFRRVILGHKPIDVHAAHYARPSIGAVSRELEKMPPLF